MSSLAGGMGPAPFIPFYHFVNALASPVIVFSGSVVAFFAALRFRRILVKPPVAIGIALFTVVFIVVSFFNPDFREQGAKPDNVPIWMLMIGNGFFLWVAFYQAVRNDERFRQGLRSDEHEAAEEKLHVWPYLIYIEAIMAAFVLAAMFYWSVALEAPLEQAANPARTPNPSKAPWYFLGLQEMLVYFDPWIAGVVLPSMIISGLIVIPYCDPNPKGVGYYTFEQRPLAITTYLFGFLVLWCLMVFTGTFLRGPNWNFFGLYENWNAHKLEPLNNVNLSEFFFQDWLKKPLPREWYKREWPGFALILGYFLLTPGLIAVCFRKLYQRLGFIRYTVLVVHFLVMLSLPIKMVLRWAFNLKYIVGIPEYFFNI